MQVPNPEKQSAPHGGAEIDPNLGGLGSKTQNSDGFEQSTGNVHAAQQSIEIAPEFESLIPPLHPDELAQLEANILAEGCRDPLVLWDDVLIDGHNRYAICRKHGIPFTTVQAALVTSIDDAILWIVSNQLGRRNITDFTRGELALRTKPIIEARAKAKQATSTGGVNPQLMQISAQAGIVTRKVVAQAAGLSHDTIRKIEKIQTSAAPEVLAAVRAGEISINAAAKVADLPAEEQAAIATASSAGIKEAVAKVAPVPKPPSDELQRLREENAELRERLAELQESLKSTLAENEAMGRAFDADDHLKGAMAEVMRQKAAADSAEQRFNAQMGEIQARIKQVVYWKNRAEKAEKALGKEVT